MVASRPPRRPIAPPGTTWPRTHCAQGTRMVASLAQRWPYGTPYESAATGRPFTSAGTLGSSHQARISLKNADECNAAYGRFSSFRSAQAGASCSIPPRAPRQFVGTITHHRTPGCTWKDTECGTACECCHLGAPISAKPAAPYSHHRPLQVQSAQLHHVAARDSSKPGTAARYRASDVTNPRRVSRETLHYALRYVPMTTDGCGSASS